MAGIQDVAKKAGVSIATVSNVIGKRKAVSGDLRKRVEAAIIELDYQVNHMASGLKSKKTFNIGVILPKISNAYFPPILQGIEDTTRKYGYRLMYFNVNFDFETEKSYVELMKANLFDGVIIDSCCDLANEKEYSKYLFSLGNQERKIPIVSLERKMDVNYINSVVVDNYYYAYLITKYLIDIGHKKILHITGPMKLSMCVDILEGYKKALSESNIQFEKRFIMEGNYTPMVGYNLMKQFLTESLNASALFATNDQTAIGAVKAIKEAGIKIPEEMAIAGFDNIFVGTLVEPSITTVNVPRYKLGYESVELLVKHINNPGLIPESIKLDCNIVIRRSSDIKGDNSWDLYGW